MQEAEFAVVGIGIALLRSHTQKAALALNRSGDYAVAGREIAFISERAECTTPTSKYYALLFVRRVTGLLSAHREGAVCTSPWLHAECNTPTAEYYVSAFIKSHNPF